MKKVNWAKLTKSVLASAAGSWVGASISIFLFWFVIRVDADGMTTALRSSFWQMLRLGPVLTVAAFAAMLVIGLPIQAQIQKSGKTGFEFHALPAALAGLLIPCLFGIAGIIYSPAGCLAGLIAGSLFWLIRRPDRDEMPPRSAIPETQL